MSSALALTALAVPAAAVENVQVERLEGADRFRTAVEIASQRLTADDQAIETVLLARADDFPDALAGAGLAGGIMGIDDIGAPVLLTESERLTPVTAQALEEFSTRRVVLLGGTNAISEQVADALAADYDVTRIDGQNRYGTAAEAARTLVANTAGLQSVQDLTTVFVANGLDFADALAIGPIAYAAQVPILLTSPDALPAETAAVLQELDPEQAIVLGGPAAVSPEVAAQIRDIGPATQRIGGANRLETAAMIATFAIDEVGFDADEFALARGDAFPDALAGAPRAGETQSPLLLTQGPTQLGGPTRDALRERSDVISLLRLFGGPSAITPETAQAAEEAAETVGDGGTVEPFPADPGPETQPASAGASLNLTDVEVGLNVGYDRVVLELAGDGNPGYDVRYVETPVQQGSGMPADVRGNAFLQVDLRGIALPTSPDGQPYEGPEQIVLQTTEIIAETEVGTVFEGVRRVFIGLDSAQPFRVFQLDDPTRVVIDVQHPTDQPPTTDQTFGIAPQEALTVPVGQRREFRVFTRYGDEPFTGPVDIGLYPCEGGSVVGAGPDVLADADDDGQADLLGEAETAARIIGVNGEPAETTVVRGAEPGADDVLRFNVNAAAADCTIPVVFEDVDGDGELAVDDQGRPTEPFGVARITWE